MMSKRYNLKEWTENRSILQTWENRNELFVLFFHRELITQSRERVKSINSHRHNRQSFKRASHNFYKFTFLQSDVIFNTIFWNCNSPVATILWQKKTFFDEIVFRLKRVSTSLSKYYLPTCLRARKGKFKVTLRVKEWMWECMRERTYERERVHTHTVRTYENAGRKC